jgi:rare lipoprotein A
VLSRHRLGQLLWVVLLICGLFVFGSDRAEAEEALASWYGPGFDGRTTADGETYDADDLSTAHPSLPMGTDLIVSYEGESIPVTVNDRGPFTGNRELDLSQGAAEQLGLIQPGVDYVEVTCADGGIYPNCMPDTPAPQEGIAVEEVPAYTPVQDATTPQYKAAPQYETTPQYGTVPQNEIAPRYETVPHYETAVQDGTSVQDSAGGAHMVQPGETLYGIAAQLGTSVDDLTAQNGITDPSYIYADQTLFY